MAIHTVLIGFHLGLFMILLREPEPPALQRHPEKEGARDAIRVRLIAMEPQRNSQRDAASQSRALAPKLLTTRTPQRSVPKHTASTEVPTGVPPPSDEGHVSDTPPPDADAHVDYVPGGALLGAGPSGYSQRAHLPGSDRVIVSDIALIDPDKQGVKHVAQRLQHYLGIPDRHCLDVDSWRTMSRQELVDRHISPEQVDQIAQKYKCD